MSTKPAENNPLFQLLQDEKINDFNEQKKSSTNLDLTGAFLRGLDLRNVDFSGLNLSNAYFRGADLRGIDFSQVNLEGASIAETKISGCYFPKELSAEEIRLSLEKGTRLRYQT